jgi:hypothetical protein
MRAHGNSEHGLKWVAFDEHFRAVQMQTWFRCGRQRYWVVTEGVESATGQPSGPVESRGGRSKVNRRPGGHRRRVAEVGVEPKADQEEGEERAAMESGCTEGATTATGCKRQASPRMGGEDCEHGSGKRVRFAGQVEIGGLEGLQQQLKRWSKECVVCFLAGGRAAEPQTQHTVWECRQEVAEGIRMDSRYMGDGMRAGPVGGCCRGCSVPRMLCERWQWGARWEESTGRCQYEGVLISTMMAMAELGRAEGRRQVGEWLRRDGVDPRGPEAEVYGWFRQQIWWEGIETGQLVLVFMMLARINGALQVLW